MRRVLFILRTCGRCNVWRQHHGDQPFCDACMGPLRVAYDHLDAAKQSIDRLGMRLHIRERQRANGVRHG